MADTIGNISVPESAVSGTFPKLVSSVYVAQCNHCERPPCVEPCPSGATSQDADGVVRVDKAVCIGCGFCIQACPYGCRFLSPVTHTAEKCTLCYHRITRGLKPACVEVCPSQTRIFGDLKHAAPGDRVSQSLARSACSGHGSHL